MHVEIIKGVCQASFVAYGNFHFILNPISVVCFGKTPYDLFEAKYYAKKEYVAIVVAKIHNSVHLSYLYPFSRVILLH